MWSILDPLWERRKCIILGRPSAGQDLKFRFLGQCICCIQIYRVRPKVTNSLGRPILHTILQRKTKSDKQYREIYIAYNFTEKDQKWHSIRRGICCIKIYGVRLKVTHSIGRPIFHSILQRKTKSDTQYKERYILHTVSQRKTRSDTQYRKTSIAYNCTEKDQKWHTV